MGQRIHAGSASGLASLFLLILLGGYCSVGARSTSDGHLQYAGSALWSHYVDIVASDSVAFAALINGLQVVDFSNPAQPVIVQQVYWGGERPMSLALEDSLLLVGGHDVGLRVFRVDGSGAIEYASAVLDSAYVPGVSLNGQLAYVSHDWGLRIFDCSQPESLVLLGGLTTADSIWATGIAVADGIAVLVGGTTEYVDVSNPRNPFHLSSLYTAHWPRAVEVQDSIAFIAEASLSQPTQLAGISAVDFRNPSNPQRIGVCTLSNEVTDVAVAEGWAYVSAGMSGLVTVGISVPSVLLPVDCHFVSEQAGALDIFDSTLILTNNRMAVDGIDLAYDNCGVGLPDSIGSPDRGELQVLSIADPEHPQFAGKLLGYGHLQCASFSADNLFAGDDAGWLYILQSSSPQSISVLSDYRLPQPAEDVVPDGVLLYVACGREGLLILNVASSDSIIYLGKIQLPGSTRRVDVQGSYAYIAGGSVGIHVVDISDPMQPELLSSMPTADMAADIAVSGSFAYVADRYAGLKIVDVADPRTPSIIGGLPGLYSSAVEVQDTLVVVNGAGLFAAINVVNAEAPVLIGAASGTGTIRDLAINGDFVYLAAADAGVMVFDISSLPDIQLVERVETPGDARRLWVDGESLLLTDRFSVIRYDLPTSTGVHDDPRDAPLPEGHRLHQNYPNPFNAETTIQLDLPQRDQWAITIYNMLGQHIQEFAGESGPGTVTVQWDAGGCASGIYLYRAAVRGYSESHRMLLLK